MATAKSTSTSSTKAANDPVNASDIEADIQRIREDIAALAGSLKNYGSEKSQEYKTRATTAGEDLTQMSQDALDDLTRELKSYERALTDEVRRHPLQSLGIAAGVGFLIAALIRR
ncbi:YqjD family protein [Roseibium alexandrii]